jgi:hypothetical protein
VRPEGAGDVRQRIIIHAGFAKCGSASIRTPFFQNFRELQKHDVFVFDKDLRIARAAADLVGTPIWSLEEARKKSENLSQRLVDEIGSVIKHKTYHLAILSAENLANPGMNELFAGLDSRFEVWLIFYLRPQLQWLPSAWKQWGLKEGVPLGDFVSQCIDAYRPSFKLAIDAWKSALPAAKVHVRFLIPELLREGNPVQDFFQLIGCLKTDTSLKVSREIPALTSQSSTCSRRIRICFLEFMITL